jgi:Tol biopolymer transport system component
MTDMRHALVVLALVLAALGVPTQVAAAERSATTAPGLSVVPARPMKGERAVFSGRAPRARGPVVLQRKVGQRWRKVAAGTVKQGRYRITTRVRRAGTYRVHGATFTSRPRKVRLATQEATLDAVDEPFVVDLPRFVTATVSPARTGRVVRLQALVSGTWVTVATAPSGADGSAAIRFGGTTPGTTDYRVVGARFRGAPASPPSATETVHTARRLDVASAGAPDGTETSYADVSADGRWVAFASEAQLLPADSDATYDIYLLDRTTDALEGVLLQANDTTVVPSLSADGRYLAFQSQATNLGSGADAAYDVFVLDRRTGGLELVSRSAGGGDGNGVSAAPTITDDGRGVVWASTASNLVSLAPPPDTTVRHGWFRDLETGIVRALDRISLGWTDEDVDETTISGDGSRIAFTSSDADLDPGGVVTSAVFTWDVAADGTFSNRENRTRGYFARGPFLTADGDTLTFTTGDDLVPADINGDRDVYVQPVGGTAVTLASPPGGAEPSRSFGISADGRFVLMTTRNPLPGDGNGIMDDVVVWDSESGTHRLAASGNAASLDPAMSADGSVVTFSSESTNLIGPGISGDSNVFVAVLR